MIENKVSSKSFIETTNKFLCHGNPIEAKCFLFGSEEHGPFLDKPYFDKWVSTLKEIELNNEQFLYSNKQEVLGENGYVGKISYLQYKLQIEYFKNYSGDIEQFRNDIHNYFGFWSNVKPLGDNNESSWSEFNMSATGFNDKNDYFEHIWNKESPTRKDVLRTFLQSLKSRIDSGENMLIFNFGSTESFSPYKALLPIYKDLGFKFILEDMNKTVIKNKNSKKYWWTSSECHRVWFAGHPGNDWFSNEVSDQIVDEICKFLK